MIPVVWRRAAGRPLTVRRSLVQIPESAGPVCITYNLPKLTKALRLSADALAGIFLGTVKNCGGLLTPDTAQQLNVRADRKGVAVRGHLSRREDVKFL